MPSGRVAYLGPAGTFCEAAARSARTITPTELVAMAEASDIAAAVESGTVDFGVVPIENSVHGTVLPTLDTLVFDRAATLVREEIVIEVSFNLFRNPRSTTEPTTVFSHPAALQQCEAEIVRRGLRAEPTTSTAEACRLVSTTEPDALCIGAAHAGAAYGLDVVASRIEDRDGGRTRFYVLSRTLAAVTGSEHEFRTALVLTPGRDRPGILLEMLRPFAERGLNLSSLMSRPLRSGLGLYCFIVIVDAHIDAPRFGAALSELIDGGARVKNLGSFIAWPQVAAASGAHAEYPIGSVAASDAPERHQLVFDPPSDPVG